MNGEFAPLDVAESDIVDKKVSSITNIVEQVVITDDMTLDQIIELDPDTITRCND